MKRNLRSIPEFRINHEIFKTLFFPLTMAKWDILDPDMRSSENTNTFENNSMKELAFLTTLIRKECKL